MATYSISVTDMEKEMEQFVEFLGPYREKSKKMILYSLFLVVKDIPEWEVDPDSDYGDCTIFVPKAQWSDSLGQNLKKVASTIPGLKVNDVDRMEAGYCLEVNDTGYGGSFVNDMNYLGWLWDPVRKSTVRYNFVNSHRYRGTDDGRILDILERAPLVIIEPTQDMLQHPLWSFYLQIENRKWQIYSADFTDDKFWLIFAHGYGDGVEHPVYDPVTHIVDSEVPGIIEWMDLHRHPILYQR